MTTFRFALLAALLVLSACSSAQVAGVFQGWCRHADTCTDNTKPQRP
ncbi:hypothetical protein [Azospirillum sp. TSO22-1]|nr:hypothetical protein [Azospirillum sp. TSO22-1]